MCYAINAIDQYDSLKAEHDGFSAANIALLQLSQWLDNYNAHKPKSTQLWERIGKIGEENGEVIAAMIGWGGQNPRKGSTHSVEDVEKEMFDVVITALGAIIHLHENDPKFNVLEVMKERIMDVDARRKNHPAPPYGAKLRRMDYVVGSK